MNYTKIYNAIISTAKQSTRRKGEGVYYEAHHIIPVCLGGKGRVEDYEFHPNIVLLTAKEHYICHRLLCSMYPTNDKLRHAFRSMLIRKSTSQERFIPSPRVFERVREDFAKDIKALNTGKKKTREQINKTLETKKRTGGFFKSKETIRRGVEVRKLNGSYVQSEEHKKKGALARSVRVLHVESQQSFTSKKEAAKYFGITVDAITWRLKKGIYKLI